ncbi:cation diffusion facilitator family transporter [Aliifodinibius salicampi]|uniref:Cation diffusion facilitator family transporter n=1 Tax=Fodinibius salicampi TaxID=1920655 RepID=A0ABT3PVT4_9BACT|nr:cation diffusion facilitator family transporter [Fodinibius salicampi]MCW9711972.1 cation diffusion facilitator family transporter [Fodinibius salicampi]
MASGSKKVIYAALIANAIIAVVKFIAAAITGSSAMFSEGIHTTVDTGNQLMLLLGLKKAKKPADKLHPFGYGKEIYFWSFVVAIMIFAIGAGISIYEGIHSVLDPHPIENAIVSYGVLGAAMVITGIAWYFAWKEFKQVKGNRGYFEAVQKEKNPTTFVVLFEDSAALLGLFVAILGIGLSQWTGMPVFDGIASIVIGLILGTTAAWLAYETKGLLIGESADPRMLKEIEKTLSSYNKIRYVNEVLTLHMGPNFVLLNISVDFQDDISSDQIEVTSTELSKELKSNFPLVKRVFIESEKSNDA